MLKNNTAKEIEKEKIIKVEAGAFFVNNKTSECDILIIENEDGDLKMLNAHCFNTIRTKDSIEHFLNKNEYYEVEAEIIRTK